MNNTLTNSKDAKRLNDESIALFYMMIYRNSTSNERRWGELLKFIMSLNVSPLSMLGSWVYFPVYRLISHISDLNN